MNITLAISILERIYKLGGGNKDKLQLAVKVTAPNAIGGTPRVLIKNISAGFDWDNGTILLEPEQPLTKLTEEQLADVKQQAKNANSYEAYAYYNKLKDEIKTLKAEVERLTALTNTKTKKQTPAKPLTFGGGCDLEDVTPDLPILDLPLQEGTPILKVNEPQPKAKPFSPYTTKVSLFALPRRGDK